MKLTKPLSTMTYKDLTPVLFSDGLPGDGDVDEDGNLWLWDDCKGDWEYVYIVTRVRADITRTYSQWLPFYDNPLEWNWK